MMEKKKLVWASKKDLCKSLKKYWVSFPFSLFSPFIQEALKNIIWNDNLYFDNLYFDLASEFSYWVKIS